MLIPITHDYVMFSTAMVPCVYQISRLVKLSIANSFFVFFYYAMTNVESVIGPMARLTLVIPKVADS